MVYWIYPWKGLGPPKSRPQAKKNKRGSGGPYPYVLVHATTGGAAVGNSSPGTDSFCAPIQQAKHPPPGSYYSEDGQPGKWHRAPGRAPGDGEREEEDDD